MFCLAAKNEQLCLLRLAWCKEGRCLLCSGFAVKKGDASWVLAC